MTPSSGVSAPEATFTPIHLMAHTAPAKSSGSPIVGIVVGFILMLGGMFAHQQIGRVEPAGIPLEPGKTIAAIGVFLILFPVIKSFFVTPLETALHERNSSLEATFGEAESLRTEMKNLRTEYEARLVATEAQARETIQGQIKEAQSLRASLMAEAQSRADALVENARVEVTGERSRLMTELRTHVTELALSAAERVVGENMDTDRNRRIVDDFIASTEVPAAQLAPTPAVVATDAQLS